MKIFPGIDQDMFFWKLNFSIVISFHWDVLSILGGFYLTELLCKRKAIIAYYTEHCTGGVLLTLLNLSIIISNETYLDILWKNGTDS